MAILGGVGNPVGGSFTGPAEALEIVGDHAYAYSGIITHGSSSVTTFLKFTSGNYYFVGELAFFNTEGGNSDMFLELKMNGAIVVKGRYAGIPGVGNLEQATPIIIPSYTEFEGLLGTDVSQELTMSLTGRIYRAID